MPAVIVALKTAKTQIQACKECFGIPASTPDTDDSVAVILNALRDGDCPADNDVCKSLGGDPVRITGRNHK